MMKKLMMLAVGGVLSATLPLAAATETVDGITWTYTVANGVASVGGGSSSSPAVPKTTSGSITIPSELGGCSVTSVGAYAFFNCGKLTNVQIPNSVTNIERYAFSSCGISELVIPDSVKSIDFYAFDRCTGLNSLTVGMGVTDIKMGAFSRCTGLTSFVVDPRNHKEGERSQR